MRIAFFADKPTSTMRPICVKMLLSPRMSQTPPIALSKHIGTMRMTASGRPQLSYCAASTRNANTTQSGKMNTMVLPAMIC